MPVYTSDRTSDRGFPWMWFIRIAAIVISIIVLGITASDSASFQNINCNIPSKLSFNLAVSIISFIILIYFLLATGPGHFFKILPWIVWLQLGLDALLFVLWLAAAASSSYTCDELCSACGFDVTYDTEVCLCYVFFKRDTSPVQRSPLEKRRTGRGSDGGGSTIAAKQAFDAIMTIIFFALLCLDIFWIVQSRNSSTTTATGPPTTSSNPVKEEEAGMAPTGGVAGGAAYPQEQQQPYAQNVLMQQYPVQGQQQQHPHQQYPQQQQYPAQGQPTMYQAPQQQYPEQQMHQPQQTYPTGTPPMQSTYNGPPPVEYAPPAMPTQHEMHEQSKISDPRDGVAEMHSPGPRVTGHTAAPPTA